MCFQPTKNNQNFCEIHQKMHVDQAIQTFGKLFAQVDKKWNSFLYSLKKVADTDN